MPVNNWSKFNPSVTFYVTFYLVLSSFTYRAELGAQYT